MNEAVPTAVLFDVDGTLLRNVRRREYREMMCRMIVDIFGTEGNLRKVDFAGRTDLSIFQEALQSEGIDGAEIRSKLPELKAYSVKIVSQMSRDGDLFQLCDGVIPLLEAISQDERIAATLLTGNLEDLAHEKMKVVGISSYFSLRGAYGSDADDRNQLPAIAAVRLEEQLGEPVPPHRMVIVGDTPRDIACARHHGARVVAVASGFHTRDQLRPHTPDHLLTDLSDTEEVLRILSKGTAAT